MDGTEKPLKASEKGGQGIRTVLYADWSNSDTHGGSKKETLGCTWEVRYCFGMTVGGIWTTQTLEVEWTVWTTVSTWKVRHGQESRIPLQRWSQKPGRQQCTTERTAEEERFHLAGTFLPVTASLAAQPITSWYRSSFSQVVSSRWWKTNSNRKVVLI